MSYTENLNNKKAIEKLKKMVDEVVICLFCTDLKAENGTNCRPMSALKVCEHGNIWFFSEKNSEKNDAIAKDKNVHLFFSHPAKSMYLVVHGEAEIILDKTKIEQLWTPTTNIWLKEGKDDNTISIIKVKPSNAYYWDAESNQMINFLKMIASVVTGTNFVVGTQGELHINS